MPLNNAELLYYDANILRLPADKRKEYHAQVDRLIAELSRSIRDKTTIKITKVVKAGSFAKFTILRKTSTDPVDVDVVFYISGKSVDTETLQTLNDTIYKLLIEIYPNKDVEDFEIQRKAATVSFVGSGLSVDVVPVIEDSNKPGYGWQFDLQDGSAMQTCAPCQIQFVRDRKDKDKDFRTLVRLAKKWRNHAELKALVERAFADLRSGPGDDDDEPPAVTPGVVIRHKDIEQSHLCIGTPAYPQAHSDRHALYVLNTILGGSMSSRLFQHIREDRGLAYAVFSNLTSYRDAGVLSVYAGCAVATKRKSRS